MTEYLTDEVVQVTSRNVVIGENVFPVQNISAAVPAKHTSSNKTGTISAVLAVILTLSLGSDLMNGTFGKDELSISPFILVFGGIAYWAFKHRNLHQHMVKIVLKDGSTAFNGVVLRDPDNQEEIRDEYETGLIIDAINEAVEAAD